MSRIEDATTRGLGNTDTEPWRPVAAARRPAPRHEPEPGDAIGRYRLLERLGAGGMGVVFSAHDDRLDRKLAIKLLRGPAAHAGETSEGGARLRREAQAMAQLSHPNVVEVFDVGTEGGLLYIAMALVEGPTLRQWVHARPRSVPEIVAMYVRAGRGLSAAHAAGLVHRDFKPGNVLVDEHGQARVLDFGLALPAGRHPGEEVEPRSGPVEPLASSSMITDRLSTPVTEAGMVMGTPAYMAPEQHVGDVVGPAADQFAFCVALHEAVYGARPFTSEAAEPLLRAKQAWSVPVPPVGHPAPPELHRVLARGLRPRVEDRWPSMDALLAALEPFARPPSRRRAWAGATVASVLATSVAGWWLVGRPSGDPACLEAPAALGRAWGEPQRQALRTALAAGTAAYAADTTERVEARLDDYAARWLDLHAQVCGEAPTGADAAALRGRRLECLERRRRRMATVVEVLGDPSTDVLAQAAPLVQGLPALEGCAGEAPDDDDLVLPHDPDAAARVSEIQRELEEVQALIDAAQYARAHALAVDLQARAEALGYAPLLVRTEAWLGDALLRIGDTKAAEARLVHALHLAETADDDEQIVLIAMRLVHLASDRPDEGLQWARHAQARLSRMRPSGPAEAAMRGTLGMALLHAARPAEAVDELSRAVELWTARLAPDDLRLAAARNNLGNAYYDLGRFADAIAEHEEVLRIREPLLGPDHPDIAQTLNNLANAAMEHGQRERSLALQQRALAIWQGALGPDHPFVGASTSNLGNSAHALGRYAEAIALHERSIAVRERALGSDHPELAVSLLNYAAVLAELGRYAQAVVVLRRSRSILERTLGDHPWTVAAVSSLGVALGARGEHQEAVATLEQAWAMQQAIGGTEHPRAVEVRRRLGDALLAAGEPERARAELEAALVLQARGGVGPDESSELWLSLARALRALGEDPPRARTLAERARAAWQAPGPTIERRRARAEALLRELAP